MLPIGLIFGVVGWTIFVMFALGIFFWASRWFPRQPWFGRAILAAFLMVALMARQTKWAIPMLAVMLLVGSSFIPRKR